MKIEKAYYDKGKITLSNKIVEVEKEREESIEK
jgi:hypothetical protein